MLETSLWVDKLAEYINKHYKAAHGAKTETWSEGNSTDVFADGQDSGRAEVLYDIAQILGLEVEPLAEQEYEF